MLEATKRKTRQIWKPERADLAKKKGFKVKTRKDSLNHKKWGKNEKKKKMRGQVENLKGRLGYEKDT